MGDMHSGAEERRGAELSVKLHSVDRQGITLSVSVNNRAVYSA